MSTTEQRLQQLRFDVAASRRPPAATDVRYRLIAALVGVAALLAWGLVAPSGGPHGAQRPGPSAIAGDQQHRFPGYVKWGGYKPRWHSHAQMLRDAGITRQR